MSQDKPSEVEVGKLLWPENIHKRASAYGHDYKTPNLMFREVLDNSVDLIMKNRISLTILAYTNLDKDYHLIYDNGHGIPIYQDSDYPDEDRPITIDLLTHINVGSNFNPTTYSSGTNGIGLKLGCGLSDDFIVIINASKKVLSTLPTNLQDTYSESNKYFIIRFNLGHLQYWRLDTKESILDSIDGPECRDKLSKLLNDDLGTIVLFKPSYQFIDENKVSYHTYPFRLIKEFFQYDKDFKDLVINFSLNDKPVLPFNPQDHWGVELFGNKVFKSSVEIKTQEPNPVKLLFSFSYATNNYGTDTSGSINLLKSDRGEHIKLVQNAIGQALHRYNPRLRPSDSRIGLRLFCLAFTVKPIYTSQTKENLSKFNDKGFNPKDAVRLLSDNILEIMNSNKDYFNGLCDKILEYKRSLERLSKKDFIMSHISYSDSKNPTASLGFGSKVYDCSSKDISKRVLYLCEGKSAGNSIIRVRDPRYLAVAPLRGVPKNAANTTIENVVQNPEFKSIINILGTGVGGLIRMDKRRYDKVYIAADGDAAGQFIQSLLLGFFGTFMKEWIEDGRLYCILSPLFKQDGKFYYSPDELDPKKSFIRLKGLGELSKDDVRRTLIEDKKVVRVTDEDIDEAIRLVTNAGNERKKLSRELGILVNPDEFRDALDLRSSYLKDDFEDLLEPINDEDEVEDE